MSSRVGPPIGKASLARIVVFTALLLAAAAAFAQAVRLPGSTPVGSAAPPQSIAITLPRGGTLASIKVLTQGSPALDFAVSSSSPAASGSTCSPGTTYLPGQQCSIAFTFTPTAPGERRGAIVLLDRTNTSIATRLLVGQATGGVATFIPGTIATVAGNEAWIYGGDGNLATASSIFLPFGLAVDAAGNLFLADSSNNRIRRVDALTGLISTIAGTRHNACNRNRRQRFHRRGRPSHRRHPFQPILGRPRSRRQPLLRRFRQQSHPPH